MSYPRPYALIGRLAGIVMLIAPVSAPAHAVGIGAFADCVRRSGAVIYGAYWCPVCRSQLDDFQGYGNRLKYVECYSASAGRKMLSTCKAKKITSMPTWIFGDGTRVESGMSLADIASRTHCPAPRR